MPKKMGLRDDDVLGRLADLERRLIWLEDTGVGDAVDDLARRVQALEAKPSKGKKD